MKADRTLPASALIRMGADPWQVAHRLSYDAGLYLEMLHREGRLTIRAIREIHGDDYGVLHQHITGEDCGTVGGWPWTKARKRALADRVERIERRLR